RVRNLSTSGSYGTPDGSDEASPKGDRAMPRIGVFVYGVFSYVCFLATFLYAVGFVGGFGVPRSIDSPAEGPVAGGDEAGAAEDGLRDVSPRVPLTRPAQ